MAKKVWAPIPQDDATGTDWLSAGSLALVIGGTQNPLYPLFKALIELLCYPLGFLENRGRVGGVVAVVLGVAIFLAGAMFLSVSLWGLGMMTIGVAYCGFAVSRFFGPHARMQLYFADDVVPEPLSPTELEHQIATRALPFFVCVRCHLAMEPGDCGGQCPLCGSTTDCLPVKEEEERATVKAAVY